MRTIEQLQALLREYQTHNPDEAMLVRVDRYPAPEERQSFTRFLDFARQRQAHLPIYEAAYLHLVHQFVLSGSRADLLMSLERRLSALASGQGALVLIEGISGIGKTSLAMTQEVMAERAGAVFALGRCNVQSDSPFWLWRDVVQSLHKATGVAMDELPAPFGAAPQARSLRTLTQALGDWLSAIAAAHPLVVLLDDLHWAEADSLEVLDQLTGALANQPILFIATYRSEEAWRGQSLYRFLPTLHRNHRAETLRLRPLTKDDVAQLAAAYHGACHPRLVDYLYGRAEGHPLFTVELLHDLVDQRLLARGAEGLWLPPDQSVPVPTLLRQVILQRVTRLGETAEALLSHASLVGETWALHVVEHLLDVSEDALLAALDNALKADLIRVFDERNERYQFTHGLIREVLYSEQNPRRRRRLHERIGHYLEAQVPLDSARIAYHFLEAEVWSKAAHYHFVAGDQAARSFAMHRAIELFERALLTARREAPSAIGREEIDIYEHLGNAYRVLDQLVDAEHAYAEMYETALRMGALPSQCLALIHLAQTRVSQYRLSQALQTAQDALALAEQLDDPLLARAHAVLGMARLIRGDSGQAREHFERFAAQGVSSGDFVIQSDMYRQRAYLDVWSGSYGDAERNAARSLECGLKSGNLLQITGGYQILSFSQIEAGHYAEAHQCIRAALDLTGTSEDYHHQLTRLRNQMGYLYLELGDASQALEWDQRALAASYDNEGVSRYEMRRYSLLNVATDLLHLGRLEEAHEYAARFEAMQNDPDYARFRYQNRYLLLMSELRLAEQRYNEAISYAHEARAMATEYHAPKNLARSHWLEGRVLLELRQYAAARASLEQAARIADEIAHGSLRWKIRISLARAQRSSGEAPDETLAQARAMIRQAARLLAGSPLQASFDAAEWLAQCDAAVQPAAPVRVAYPAGLTEREVEILRLVAGGATNQQIADMLVISPRTVNTHITNILNKTGCDNRTAASAFAMKHNLLTT